jgi:hypothetical protein
MPVLWLACWTQEEIAGEVGMGRKTVYEVLRDLEKLPNSAKFTFQDDFQVPIRTTSCGFSSRNEKINVSSSSGVRLIGGQLIRFFYCCTVQFFPKTMAAYPVHYSKL